MADDKTPTGENGSQANGNQVEPAATAGNSSEEAGPQPVEGAGPQPAEGAGQGEGNGENLEQLQEQLKEMEEEQSKLAQQIEQNEKPKLDSHLAVIEEQFRHSFDDRFSAPASRSGRPVSYISRFDTGSGSDIDLIKLNSIFRDVSRDLGDDWKPVFTELTKKFPADVVAAELEKLEQMQPIIHGYRSLNVWKELSGPDFNARDLIDALRKTEHNDVADQTAAVLEGAVDAPKSKPVSRRKSDVSSRSRTSALDNRRMLLLAKKVGGDWEELGKALGLPEEELKEIKEGPDSSTYQGAFKVLWAWRQTQPEVEQASSVETLKNALIKANKQTLAEQLGS